ncbi:hypothetical protein LZ32DRAFT_660313 [Colletotrichum eremochloae]|nr:hypothetical protein LZ32DRAFT_660313 [Colletotrichum eremochloae]
MTSQHQHQQQTFSYRHAESGAATKTFEKRRAELIAEIAASLNQVNANINALNRSLETVITELWSNFEDVMVKKPEPNTEGEDDGETKRETGTDRIK